MDSINCNNISDISSLQTNLNDFVTEIQIFCCKLCPYICTQQQIVYNHLFSEHSTQNVDSKIRFKCPGCTNVFYSETSLESHLLHDHLMSDDDIKIVLKSKDTFDEKCEINALQIVNNSCPNIVYIRDTVENNDKIEIPLDISELNSHENLYIAVNECKMKPNSESIVNGSPDKIKETTNKDYKLESNTESTKTQKCDSKIKVLKVILPKKPSTDNSDTVINLDTKSQKVNSKRKVMKTKNIIVKKRVSSSDKTKQCNSSSVDGKPPASQSIDAKISAPNSTPYPYQKQKKMFKCAVSYCPVKMKESSNMEYHQRCHDVNTSSLFCPECNGNFMSWASLSGHLWRTHKLDLELYACDTCDYRTPILARLNSVHKLTHSSERPFLCAICAKAFKNRKQLHNHETTVHRKRGNIVGTTTFICSTCGRGFGDARHLRLHISSIHERVRPYLCGHCGYRSSSRAGVRLHERRHTGEKPYACNECPFRTADHNSLRRHNLTHGGRRPYSCTICNYSCIQSSTFKLHLKNKHPQFEPDVVFSCPYCTYRALRHDAYDTHLSKHQQNNDVRDRSKTENDPLLSAQNNSPHKNFLSESIGQFNLAVSDNSELRTKQTNLKEELKIEVIEEKLRLDNNSDTGETK